MTDKHKSNRLVFLGVAALLLAIGLACGGSISPPQSTPVNLPPTFAPSGDAVWWDVMFTDPNTESLDVLDQLLGYIFSAGQSIEIAAFEFNLDEVAEALLDAHRRGVRVRWITDDEHGLEADLEEGHGQFRRLENAGIEVIDDGRSALMHNKFWIFDRQIVWTGSTNITENGNFHNNNNVIVIDSPDLAAIYAREFEEMWAGEFGPRSPSTVNQQFVVVEDTEIQVMFAPEDDVIDYLAELVSTAETSIYVMAFSFTHDTLGEAILERYQAGIDVFAIFETRASQTEFSELPRLYCANVPVRQDGNSATFHHKVIVIDGQLVVTGSLNFSNNADESNDENVLVIGNDEIASRYVDEFTRRWNEASDPDPADISCS